MGIVMRGVWMAEVVSSRTAPDRLGCLDGVIRQEQPINRVNTTLRLQQLRVAMSAVKLVRGAPLKAYIITSDDEHQCFEDQTAGYKERDIKQSMRSDTPKYFFGGKKSARGQSHHY
ncbi:hypothetical protein OUZ56_023011 [Daphnia magna]|uniref:Uncharacterized protein n=1 Tax=Daphnia magna TaxID=35525 RepID=A0ABR0AY68_9CRUS|nr:hypothetical protein OUZ56_023011 [Daphnia magna]